MCENSEYILFRKVGVVLMFFLRTVSIPEGTSNNKKSVNGIGNSEQCLSFLYICAAGAGHPSFPAALAAGAGAVALAWGGICGRSRANNRFGHPGALYLLR